MGLSRLPADGSTSQETWLQPPALLSRDGRYSLRPSGTASALASRPDGLPGVSVPTSGQGAVWSPGGQLAWPTYGNAERDDWIPLTVWAADPFAGGAVQPRRVLTVYGGRL